MIVSKKIGKNYLYYSEDDNKKTSTCEQVVASWDKVVNYVVEDTVTSQKGLREAQLGAIFAIRAHWIVNDSVATIVMPTGTGKTETMITTIESKIRPANSSTALLGFSSYSLEHLMPKKWRNNWSACATEDEAKKRDSVLLTLGNLAIITQSLNASIRDAAWEIKKAGKGVNKPGLDLCAGGLHTLYDALGKNVWNENEIETRASWLCEQAKAIWKI